MSICFYCENNEAITSKFNEAICEGCNNTDIRSSIRPTKNEDEGIKARRLQFWIRTFAELEKDRGEKGETGKTFI